MPDILLAILLVTACSGGERVELTLRVLAPTTASGSGCGSTQHRGTCAWFKLDSCDSDLPAAICTPATQLANGELFMPVERPVPFDLPAAYVAEPHLRLRTSRYDGEALYATAEWRNAVLEGNPSMSLWPVNQMACGGELSLGLARRAFHTATLLPNGEILLLGGLSGEVSVRGDSTPLEPTVEILNPTTGEHFVVKDGEDGEDGEFRRAFHCAFYVRQEQGRYVVRVVGGVGQAVISENRGTRYQLLAFGAEGEQPADAVDIRYDPLSRSFEPLPLQGDFHSASFIAEAAYGPVGHDRLPGATDGIVLAGGLGLWQGNSADANSAWVRLARNGTPDPVGPQELLVGRVGATAFVLGGSELLVWGGNVGSGPSNDDGAVRREMAEYHSLDGSEEGFVEIQGDVDAAAFHAAAVAWTDGATRYRIVVAGGYKVTDLGTLHVTDFATPDVYVVDYDTATHRADIRPVSGAESVDLAVAYLTATVTAPGKVLLVGGNYVHDPDGPMSGFKYASRAVAGVVSVDGEEQSFDPASLAFARYGHTATRLHDGPVVVVGGLSFSCPSECADIVVDPDLRRFEVFSVGSYDDLDQEVWPETFDCIEAPAE